MSSIDSLTGRIGDLLKPTLVEREPIKSLAAYKNRQHRVQRVREKRLGRGGKKRESEQERPKKKNKRGKSVLNEWWWW